MEAANAEVQGILDDIHDRRTIDVCRWLLGLQHSLPMAELGAAGIFVTSCRVRFFNNRRWDFAPRWQGSTEAVVFPVTRLADGDLIIDDLVAFPFGRPNDWALACGRAAILGEIEARDPIALRESRDLRAVGDPLAWLRSAGRSVCILRPEAAATALPIAYMVQPRRLVADSEGLARHLQRILRGLSEAENIAFIDRRPSLT